jgi:hypothetical protein
LEQSIHVQDGPQSSPALKHSQYFFKQPVLLQRHPFLCDNAEGLLVELESLEPFSSSFENLELLTVSNLQSNASASASKAF